MKYKGHSSDREKPLGELRESIYRNLEDTVNDWEQSDVCEVRWTNNSKLKNWIPEPYTIGR